MEGSVVCSSHQNKGKVKLFCPWVLVWTHPIFRLHFNLVACDLLLRYGVGRWRRSRTYTTPDVWLGRLSFRVKRDKKMRGRTGVLQHKLGRPASDKRKLEKWRRESLDTLVITGVGSVIGPWTRSCGLSFVEHVSFTFVSSETTSFRKFSFRER